MGQSVPAKILFGDQTNGFPIPIEEEPVVARVLPRLIPPSERVGLPANMVVTSVDVEEGMRTNKKRKKPETLVQDEIIEPISTPMQEGGLDLNAIERQWGALGQIKDQINLMPGTLVGWKVGFLAPKDSVR